MNKGTILIVDDSRAVLGFLESLFLSTGYTVYSAKDGSEAWRIVLEEDIDLILSDLEMPVCDGFELCSRVKQDNDSKQIYFIILSTRNEDETKVKGLTVGADDYIIKTTSHDELLARVEAGMRVRCLQQELKETQAYLYRQEKMASIGQLAAGVAHEINNPIGYVASNLSTLSKYINIFAEYIETIRQEVKEESLEELNSIRKRLKIDYITEDAKDLICESLDGTERVSKIVQGLKSFSCVDEVERRPVDINECLENTINIVCNELNYEAKVQKEFAELPLTRCFAQQLNQVFMNLLLNASQAIGEQGEITIKTWEKDEFIFVSITDNGCGIAEESLHRLFEPFFTTREVGKGTGLGLSTSYDIIKKHGGTIDVDSEVGKGSTFTVEIPLC